MRAKKNRPGRGIKRNALTPLLGLGKHRYPLFGIHRRFIAGFFQRKWSYATSASSGSREGSGKTRRRVFESGATDHPAIPGTRRALPQRFHTVPSRGLQGHSLAIVSIRESVTAGASGRRVGIRRQGKCHAAATHRHPLSGQRRRADLRDPLPVRRGRLTPGWLRCAPPAPPPTRCCCASPWNTPPTRCPQACLPASCPRRPTRVLMQSPRSARWPARAGWPWCASPAVAAPCSTRSPCPTRVAGPTTSSVTCWCAAALDPRATLASWASPDWATGIDPEAGLDLPPFPALPRPGSLGDDAVTAFLCPNAPSEDNDLATLISPPRLATDADRRRQLLTLALRGCLQVLQSSPAAPRGRFYLLAEPGLTALLLYAAVRLLPRSLTANLTFSTYENAQPATCASYRQRDRRYLSRRSGQGAGRGFLQQSRLRSGHLQLQCFAGVAE